jgi:TusA-related sulfurtransferase
MTRFSRGIDGEFDEDLLDDPRRLEATDSGGLLRAAATAGAQVRATTAAAEEAGLAQLAGQRPRALVLLTRPGAAPAAAPLLLALVGPSCPVPVVTTRSVPMWVGALDIVLANTTDPGDRELAEGIDRALRRGAQVVLSAPAEGPVAAAAAGRAVLLGPRLEVPPGLTLPRALTAGLLLLDTLKLLATDTEVLAGELDREAERDYVAHESLVNPAKALALRLQGRTPLLWGTDPVATAVAGHWAGGEADVFHDPFDDDQPGNRMPAMRPVLLGVPADARYEAERAAASEALPGADLVTVDEELMMGHDDPGAATCAAAVLALRFDFAALYLGLGRGVLGGPNWAGSAGTQPNTAGPRTATDR